MVLIVTVGALFLRYAAAGQKLTKCHVESKSHSLLADQFPFPYTAFKSVQVLPLDLASPYGARKVIFISAIDGATKVLLHRRVLPTEGQPFGSAQNVSPLIKTILACNQNVNLVFKWLEGDCISGNHIPFKGPMITYFLGLFTAKIKTGGIAIVRCIVHNHF